MIKRLLKKIIQKEKASSKDYAEFLKRKGCRIGFGTTFFEPMTTCIDITRPWLIDIGENVQITGGVTVLTHGYDWSVLKGKYGDILGSSGKVKIGNNVFIGRESTILKGVTIGNNVIIGANSLVNKDIPDNCVAAGNPCKVICDLETYYNKRISMQVQESTELAIEYYKVYGKWPDRKVLREFVFLFEDRNQEIDNNPVFVEIGHLVNNYETTKNKFLSTKGEFENYEKFIEYCKDEYEKMK